MIKFIKMLIGLLLIPSCWAVSVAVFSLYQASQSVELIEGMEAWALPIGFMLWIVIFFVLPRPMRTYVLGHELTHAIWSLMMGGRVGKMKVSKEGGHVELTKTNFLVALAPYFFPFYTFIIIGLYYLAALFLDLDPYRLWWLGAIGFSWSFHVTFTLVMLAGKQPDVMEHGHLFSYVFIYIMNILGMGIWVALVGQPTFLSLWELLCQEHIYAYGFVGAQIALVYGYFMDKGSATPPAA